MTTKKKTTPTKTPTVPPSPILPKPEAKPVKVEMLVLDIKRDDEVLSKVPTLAQECKFLQFTSSSECQSMEKWQILFEQNGFRFVRNTYDPTIRTMLFESLK